MHGRVLQAGAFAEMAPLRAETVWRPRLNYAMIKVNIIPMVLLSSLSVHLR